MRPRTLRPWLLAAACAAGGPAAFAQDPQSLSVRGLAASCASCHGTAGHAVPGSAMPALAGMAREHLLQQMRAFRDGSRPATVMHQLARGFSDAQLEQLASYFAAQPK